MYLSAPERTAAIEEGVAKDGSLSYAVGEVQGWRKTMEDAHISNTDVGVFAVFDGHGGKAVAKFAQAKYVNVLTQLKSFKAGNYVQALRESFHKIDELLEDPKYDALLKRFQAIPNPSEKKSFSSMDVIGLDDEDLVVDEDEDEDEGGRSLDENLDANAMVDVSTKVPGGAATTGKKKLTTAQAVQFFHKLLVMESAKRKEAGAGVKGSAPSSSSVAAAAASVHVPGNGGSIGQSSPASIQTPHGKLVCGPFFVCDATAHTLFDSPLESRMPHNPSLPFSTYKLNSGPICNLSDHRVPSGCTAIVAFKAGQQLYVANAGDSRGCLCRDGVAVPLSEDHKPLEETERRRVEAAGGFVSNEGRVNGNLNLSRSLGDLKYKQVKGVSREGQMITAEPDVSVTTLCSDDRFFVLACDGVWDIMTCQEICDFVSERLDAGISTVDIVKQVFDHCIAQDIKTSGGLGGDNQVSES